MEQVLPKTPMRGWSILTTIENLVHKNGPSVADTEAIYAGCLGQEGDPYSVKVPSQHLFWFIKLWGRFRAFWGAMSATRINRVGLVMSELIPV